MHHGREGMSPGGQQPQQQRQQQGQHKRGREAGEDRGRPGGGPAPNKWISMAQRLIAVTEESAVGCNRLYEMQVSRRGGRAAR